MAKEKRLTWRGAFYAGLAHYKLWLLKADITTMSRLTLEQEARSLEHMTHRFGWSIEEAYWY
jgi:hypothetical protein